MKGYFSKLRIFHQNYHMVRSKSENIITVDQPMVLISQAPRSGGTLLKRLFDNHNECHVYPVEFAMGINKDVDYSWPDNLLSMKKKEWLENAKIDEEAESSIASFVDAFKMKLQVEKTIQKAETAFQEANKVANDIEKWLSR